MSKFFTSFFDGLTGAGILGDLSLPNAPNRMFTTPAQNPPRTPSKPHRSPSA